MKLKWFFSTTIIALLLAAALIGLAGHDSIVAAQDGGAKIEGLLLDKFATDGTADYIVRFSEQADLSAADAMDWSARGEFVYNTLRDVAANSQMNAKALLDVAGLNYQTFIAGNELYVWSGTQVSADQLAALPEVDFIRATRTYYIDPDVVSSALDSISWAGDFLANNVLTTVADSPDATIDWGILDTHADQAWVLGARGAGIKVANIDTGVQWDHPALVNQYACPGDPTDPDCWEDPSDICPGGSMCDNQGHGTHTMGTMVALDDPALLYIAGMAPDATWIACKGCESDSCSDLALNGCADWILAPGGDPANRPDVVNNSWGGDGCDSWYQAKVQAWRAAGIFPAFSAGNASGCGSMGSPGDYQESFASTGHNSTRAHVYSQGPSCYGHEPYTKPNVTAPASAICSTVPGNAWSCGYSGTSMASPHSAGAVAQVWSVCPAYMGQIDQTFELLQDFADPPDPVNPGCGAPPDGEGTYEDGYGYLNVLAAVGECTGGLEFGALDGYVYDLDGEPVEGATVVALPSVLDNQITAETDPTGYYTMTLLAGTYDVTASKVNYVPETIYDVVVLVDEVTHQDFEIEFLGAWTELPKDTSCPDWTRIDLAYYEGTGLAYLMGGRNGTVTEGNIFSYDPATNTCEDTGQIMPVPISNYTILQLNDGADDQLCVFGGRDNGGGYATEIQCYNPVANTVATVGTLPPAYGAFIPGGMAVVDNIAYIFGGLNTVTTPYATVDTWAYDPVAESWTQKGDITLGRGYIQVAVADGLIYGFGGDTFDGVSLYAQTITEVFDPAIGTWDDASVADLATASGEGRGFGFDSDSDYVLQGKIVLAGGGIWSEDTNAVIAYDIATDTYDETIANLNVERRDHAGFFVPGDPSRMFVFGGYSAAAGYGGDNPPYAPPEYFDVNLIGPDIEVTPEELNAELAADSTTTLELTIENVGNTPLDWDLVEVPGMVDVKVNPPSIPTATTGREVQLSLDAVQNPAPQAAEWIPTGPVSLSLDDGVAENAIGIGGTWEFVWVNRFTPDPADYPFTLDTVSVLFPSWGGVLVGDSMTLVLYENTTGNTDPAAGSNFLAAFPVTVQALDVFYNYTLPYPVLFTGPGDVVVGVIDNELPMVSYWPAAQDITVSQQRSWAGWWSVSPPPYPPSLPPDDTWALIDNFGFPGNWMVRASGNTLEDVPWLSEEPISGTVPAGGSVVVDVTFDSAGMDPGEYLASLNVYSNDPDTPLVDVPVSMTVLPEADLAVGKTASADEVRVGDMITYTLVVSNAGPDDAMGVTLTDTLPALVSFVSASEGCTEQDGEVTCDIGDLAMDESVTRYIIVTADAEGVAANVAEVPVPPDFVDPNLDNNMDEVDITIGPAMYYFYLPIVQKQ